VFGDVAFAQSPFAALGGGGTVDGTVAEIATAQETQNALNTLGGLIFEDATALADFSATRGLIVQLAEGAAASNTQNGFPVFSVAVAELAQATSAVSGKALVNGRPAGIQLYVVIGDTLVWATINDNQTANWQNINDAQSAAWVAVTTSQSATWQNINNAQNAGWDGVDDTQLPGWNGVPS
jgi:hypothetical protein